MHSAESCPLLELTVLPTFEAQLQRCTHGGTSHKDLELAGRRHARRNLPAAPTQGQVQLHARTYQDNNCQGTACKSAPCSWCATPLFTGCLQGGTGGAGVPQVAQDRSARQHVANAGYETTGQQHGRLAAAAQPRPAPSDPDCERMMCCTATDADLLHGPNHDQVPSPCVVSWRALGASIPCYCLAVRMRQCSCELCAGGSGALGDPVAAATAADTRVNGYRHFRRCIAGMPSGHACACRSACWKPVPLSALSATHHLFSVRRYASAICNASPTYKWQTLTGRLNRRPWTRCWPAY